MCAGGGPLIVVADNEQGPTAETVAGRCPHWIPGLGERTVGIDPESGSGRGRPALGA